jgi:hypothetical protein
MSIWINDEKYSWQGNAANSWSLASPTNSLIRGFVLFRRSHWEWSVSLVNDILWDTGRSESADVAKAAVIEKIKNALGQQKTMRALNDVVFLKIVRILLMDPTRWTRFTLARGIYEEPVSPNSELAKRYDLVGAVRRVVFGSNIRTQPLNETYWRVLRKLALVDLPGHTTEETIMVVNDDHTHEEVLAYLDAAIARETPQVSDAAVQAFLNTIQEVL